MRSSPALGSHLALPVAGAVIAGKYRIVRVLGEGGMGIVYEGVHERLAQRVAVKVLRPEIIDHGDLLVRFSREAKAAGQLRSRHAARVLDVDATAEGLPFMVMELLEGNDLDREIEQRGPLPVVEAVGYVIEACRAMVEAHGRGIIHRDLKPSNLFLATEHGERVVKVLDFGISRIDQDDAVRVTSTAVTMGTPLYMSPEQIRSTKTVDARTDIWSLSIILYEALAGRAPFEGSAVAVGAAIVADPVPPLRALRPDVPEALASVIAMGLSKNPADRHADVTAMIAALAPFAAPGAADSSPRLVVDAPSGRLLLGDDAGVASRHVGVAATVAAPPPIAAVRSRRGPVVLAAIVVLALVTVSAGALFLATRARAPGRAIVPMADTFTPPSSASSAAAGTSAVPAPGVVPSTAQAASAPASASSAPAAEDVAASASASVAPRPSTRPPRPPPRPPAPSATRNPVRL
jgi:tRNA A-37 threonylcarbamoyl transferase component Bud32